MPDLSRDQRRALDTAMRDAREAAEAGAADALRRLGVADATAPAHLDESRRALRRRLREHARSLGDKRNSDGTQGTDHLREAAAYIQWHRLLFARFLLERNLLRDADNDLVSLAETAATKRCAPAPATNGRSPPRTPRAYCLACSPPTIRPRR